LILKSSEKILPTLLKYACPGFPMKRPAFAGAGDVGEHNGRGYGRRSSTLIERRFGGCTRGHPRGRAQNAASPMIPFALSTL